MKFSFFTERLPRPSTRLRRLARLFQAFGSLQLFRAMTFVVFFPRHRGNADPASIGGLLATTTVVGTLQAVSLFLIARALVRRQRWSVYAGVAALLGPLAISFPAGMPPGFKAISIGLSLVSAGALVSVWKELDSNPSEDEIEDPEEEDREIPTRIRGYGEPKILPAEKIPVPTIVAASQPERVEVRRNN